MVEVADQPPRRPTPCSTRQEVRRRIGINQSKWADQMQGSVVDKPICEGHSRRGLGHHRSAGNVPELGGSRITSLSSRVGCHPMGPHVNDYAQN